MQIETTNARVCDNRGWEIFLVRAGIVVNKYPFVMRRHVVRVCRAVVSMIVSR